MSKKWTDLLLKSGLPFEYEVKEEFVKLGCTVWDEFTYCRTDENNIEKEFSYDIDANYWNGGSIDFMVECKYKTKETNWFFLPDTYSYQDEINYDDFFHIGDYFVNERFQYSRDSIKDKNPIGPLCLKGIEVLDNDYNETTIRRAISQVSYAFIKKFIEGINEQLFTETFFDTAFIKVPVIITNANLHRIKEKVTVEDIKKAENIEDISEKYDFIVYRNKVSSDLKNYNRDKLDNYFSSIDKDYAIKHLQYRHKDLEDFIDYISNMPELILVMHHSVNIDNYGKLFQYINELIDEKHPDAIRKRNPPDYIIKVNEQLKDILERKKKKKN